MMQSMHKPPNLSRASSIVNTMDEPDEDDDSIEDGLVLSAPSCGSKAHASSSKPSTATPFLTRLRQRMTWGSTTREEKRSLWKGGDGKPGRLKRRAQRQSNISVPTDLLLQALRRRLAAAGDAAADAEIAELSALLRLHLRHEVLESSLWLVDAFDVLSSDGTSSTAATPTGVGGGGFGGEAAFDGVGGGGGSSVPIEALSDRFIDGLCALMQRANFRLFSQREWRFAQSENFMFTLPVDVAWEALDSGTISRLFVRHPHLGLRAAQLARRVLVFHRVSTRSFSNPRPASALAADPLCEPPSRVRRGRAWRA